eukprot:TRINITY_DN62463_c0_g1_i1.p1 TRINITY_DN62463_c0_g1~~TRINITY_DN62463_c0_g1_i1.p1  ORF type:complete len:258 (-),score=64.17 TRINITY_DN62463_c0_g1_i1:1287-2060(-)
MVDFLGTATRLLPTGSFILCQSLLHTVFLSMTAGRAEYCNVIQQVLAAVVIFLSCASAVFACCMDTVVVGDKVYNVWIRNFGKCCKIQSEDNAENSVIADEGEKKRRRKEALSSIISGDLPQDEALQEKLVKSIMDLHSLESRDIVYCACNVLLISVFAMFTDPMLSCMFHINYQSSDSADPTLYTLPTLTAAFVVVVLVFFPPHRNKLRAQIFQEEVGDKLDLNVDAPENPSLAGTGHVELLGDVKEKKDDDPSKH